jgi:hypothetical protein
MRAGGALAASAEHCAFCFDSLAAHLAGQPLPEPAFEDGHWWGSCARGALRAPLHPTAKVDTCRDGPCQEQWSIGAPPRAPPANPEPGPHLPPPPTPAPSS